MGVGHQHGTAVVDNPTIDFLRNAIVIAAVPRFHMVHGNAHPSGNETEQAAIGVAEDEHTIGTDLLQHVATASQDSGDLMCEAVRVNTEMNVRQTDLELAKKTIAEVGVIILAGVNQNMIAMAIEFGNDPAQTDNLGPRAKNRDNLHATAPAATGSLKYGARSLCRPLLSRLTSAEENSPVSAGWKGA